jgi:hypothetical protein
MDRKGPKGTGDFRVIFPIPISVRKKIVPKADPAIRVVRAPLQPSQAAVAARILTSPRPRASWPKIFPASHRKIIK